MSRILRRPMFRGGSTSNEGIMSVPRKGYEGAGFVNEEELGADEALRRTGSITKSPGITGLDSTPTLIPKQPEVPQQTQNTGDISAWGFEGTGSLSESYSDWNTPTSFSSDGNSLYTFLGSNTNITGGPVEPKTENTLDKGKASGEIAARLEAMQKERKSEFNGIQRK